MNVWIQVLVANVLVATLLALLAWTATRNSATRLGYVLWLLVLIKLVTPPLVRVPFNWLPELGARIEAPPTTSPQLEVVEPWRVGPTRARPFENVNQVDRTEGDLVQGQPRGGVSSRAPGWPWLLLLVWGAGSVFLLLLTLTRLCRFRRNVSPASIPSSELSQEAGRILGATRANMPPRVWIVEAPIAPMLWPGVFRPTVYLPQELIRQLSPEEISDLLAHEMAHFRRRDSWRRWFEMGVVILYWWLPIAWWARNELERLEDEYCDDEVMSRVGASPKRYAGLLLKVVDYLSSSKVPHPDTACGFGRASLPPNAIESRIRNVLRAGPRSCESQVRWAVSMAMSGLILPFSGVSLPADSGRADETGFVSSQDSSAMRPNRGTVPVDPILNNSRVRVGGHTLYRWDDLAAVQRFPKSALGELRIPILSVDSMNALNFELSQIFAAVCLVTPQQKASVNRALARAVHDYRLLEREHLMPTNRLPPENSSPFPSQGGEARRVAESYSFELRPFPEKAAELREDLSGKLDAILGATRAKWVLDSLMERGELRMLRAENDTQRVGQRSLALWVYQLEEGDLPLVFLGKYSGTGWRGLPLGSAQDQYAPQEMQTVLKRWRKRIALRSGDSVRDSVALREGLEPSMSEEPLRTAAVWNENVPFVAIDKQLLSRLRVPAQGWNGISHAAGLLLGFDGQQGQAVLALHDRLSVRFYDLQYQNLREVEPGGSRLVIQAFPKQAAELERAWRQELGRLVGKQRMEILDTYMRIPMRRFNGPRSRARGRSPRFLASDWNGGYSWLGWGRVDIEIDLRVFDDEQGSNRFEVSFNTDSGGAVRASGSLENGLPSRIRDPLTRYFQVSRAPADF